jgi:hypothetical protein
MTDKIDWDKIEEIPVKGGESLEILQIYNAVRSVPSNAKKRITGGRLKGMTDINPMWRIKTLTEQFGPCGIGWKYEIIEKRLENGANGEIAAFVDINLYIKVNGEWSDPIPGTGGSSFVAKERSGFYTNDECFKMALTDALSVACKSLGFGADVYWEADRTKYDRGRDEDKPIPGMDDPDREQVDQLIAALKEQGKWQDSMKKAAHESALAQGLKARTPAYYQHVAGCLAKELG